MAGFAGAFSWVCHVLIGKKGQMKVLKIPGKNGYVLDERGLRWDLVA